MWRAFQGVCSKCLQHVVQMNCGRHLCEQRVGGEGTVYLSVERDWVSVWQCLEGSNTGHVQSYTMCTWRIVAFWIRWREYFCTVGRMQDPAAAHLVFVTVVALGAEGFCRKLSGFLNQWSDSGFIFHRRHPKVRNRPTILVSLESTGPNSCVSSLCVVWFSRYNCFSAFTRA